MHTKEVVTVADYRDGGGTGHTEKVSSNSELPKMQHRCLWTQPINPSHLVIEKRMKRGDACASRTQGHVPFEDS